MGPAPRPRRPREGQIVCGIGEFPRGGVGECRERGRIFRGADGRRAGSCNCSCVGSATMGARTPDATFGPLMTDPSTAELPLISVIVCCYQAEAKLPRCVESILRCDGWRAAGADRPARYRLEVVLAEGGSTDGTAAMCTALAEKSPAGLIVATTGLSKSASAKRNAGVRLAKGGWLVFTDPDIVVDAQWLLALLADFQAGETCLTGKVIQLQPGWQTSLRTSEARRHYTGTVWEQATAWKVGSACNMACTRGVFERIGGFSEDVGPGTPNGVGEDPDFYYKAMRAGVKILYDPAAVVQHDHAEDFAQFLRKKRGYFKGGVYFMARRAFFTPAGQVALALRFGYPAAMFWLAVLTFRFKRAAQAWHEWLGSWAGLWRALVAR